MKNHWTLRHPNFFFITDRTEPPKKKMFSHIDEPMKLTENHQYYLIHKDNNLIEVLLQLKKIGYEPFIRYRAGKISGLRMQFRCKKLGKSVVYNCIHSRFSKGYYTKTYDIATDTEEKSNRIAEAVFRFIICFHKDSHMFQYNDVDAEILDACRTVVPLGH